ncbi:hypothetical protein ACSBR2_001696 [Camellia fascicularis]
MKIQPWNVRGLRRPEKWRKINRSLAARKINFVMIQETKRSTITPEIVKSIWYEDNFEYMAVDVEDRAGGLLCIWNPGVLQLNACCGNRNFILLSGFWSLTNPVW